ncbi:MAG: hypothetical protein L0271_12865 [Gemmatimonadetes bacterium]|nr:hypothetical protein [Gemmatimonadota bacterium]
MFVGHYSVSFAAKSLEPRIPLWALFIAVQLADVLWAVFVWLGIERVRIVSGITATNPLDLYYMPYTHSLVAAVAWSIAALVGYRLWKRGAGFGRPALLVALAVFSHWVLDLIVHRPDLPLYDNTAKVGFGLWDYPVIAFLLEAVLLFAGIVLYLRSTRATTALGRFGPVVFGLFMLGLQSMAFFLAPPTSAAIAAAMGFGSYLVLAALAGWLDGKRVVQA